MGKRGPTPKGKVHIEWSANFAYAIGLIATDGCLSRDGRHIIFTSKDRDQIDNFLHALGIECHIERKASGIQKEKKYFVVQFSDIPFHHFLNDIGLTPAKSKTMGAIKMPPEYFFDFLRGSMDGDGYFYSYFDPRWKSSLMFYTCFVSAAQAHIKGLQGEIRERLPICGHVTDSIRSSCYQLKFAKKDSMMLIPKMYPNSEVICLERKRLKIFKVLAMIGRPQEKILTKHRAGGETADALP